MAEITATDVKRLRDMTDLPMMKCKQALQEADGNFDQAIEILKEDNRRLMVKNQDRETSEGRVFIQIADDGSAGAMVEIQCESAPVAGSDDLVAFGNDAASQLLTGPGARTADELLSQPSPGGAATLTEQFEQMVGKIRENIKVNRLARVDGPVGGYVHHDGKTGVLFCAAGENATAPVLRDVAMHIAALKPVCVHPEQLDPAVVNTERERLSEEARATGKPENIIDKIVEGRMKNFYVDQGVLVLQPFAKEDSKTVSQALAEHGLKADSFIRFTVGA